MLPSMPTKSSICASELKPAVAAFGMWLLMCYLVERYPALADLVDMIFA